MSSLNSTFKKFHPWKISNTENGPTLNIALVERQYIYKCLKDFEKKKDKLRVTTSNANTPLGYCIYTISIPSNYVQGDSIHHTVNKGCDHMFYLKPCENPKEILASWNSFIVDIPTEWLVLTHKNFPNEFQEMLDSLSHTIKQNIMEKIEIYNQIKLRIAKGIPFGTIDGKPPTGDDRKDYLE